MILPGSRYSDEERATIARAQAGDPHAFAALVARYEANVVTYVYRVMGVSDFEDARDLTQDTFLKAWVGISTPGTRPNTDPHLAVRAWLYQIALNVCKDAKRHRRLVRFVPLAPLAHVHDGELPSGANESWAVALATTTTGAEEPEQEALAAEVRDEVRAILDRLPPPYRAALVLRDLAGLSGPEAAARLGMTSSAVKSLVSRARTAFLREYQKAHPSATTKRPLSGPKGGRPRTDGLPFGAGVSRRSGKAANPWIAQPYDARNRCTRRLGCFATAEAALAVVEAWRAEQLQAAS